MKKILILGSNGFIGKNLYEYFYNKGQSYDVKAPQRNELDVLDYRSVYEYLSKTSFDLVLNCVDSQYPDYMEKRLRMFENLNACSGAYERMFYFGTGAEYGKDLPLVSVKETDFEKKVPLDTYGLCMHLMSEIAMKSDNIYNFRLFGIFGKYEKWQTRFISNSICKALFGYPITIRQDVIFDYLYIDDLCRMIEAAAEVDLEYHDYNCVSGKKFRLTYLAEQIKTILGKEVLILIAKDGLGKEYTASNQRLSNEIKNLDIQSIDLSIENLANYYKKNLDRIDKMRLLYQV